MISKLASHLMKNRHGIYYLRLTHGGKEKRKSLKTRDPLIARAAAYALGAKMSLIDPKILAAATEFKVQQQARDRLDTLKNSVDEESYFQLLLQQNPQIKIPTESAPVPVIAPSITIEDACDQYLTARADQITEGTYRTWKSCLNKLKHALAGREINTITKAEITDLISNPRGGKSQGTITKDADAWNLMFEWLVAHELATKNPIIKPTFGRAQAARLKAEHGRERLIYTDSDLKILFSKTHLDSLKRPEAVWLPLLGLATGARLESLARLRVSDISEKSIKFAVQFDKSGVGRKIPLHPLLIEAGLLTYRQEIEDEFGRESYLFTEMSEVKGRRSHYFSKMFGDQRKKMGLEVGKDFHSFRTTLISRLNKNGVSGAVRRVYVGHEVGEILDVEDLHYSKDEYSIEELAARIFPNLIFKLDDWKYTAKSALQQTAVLTANRKKTALQTERKAKKVTVDKKALAKRLEKQRIFAESKNK